MHQIPKLNCFLSCLAVVLAQSIEARCSREWRCSWSSTDRPCSNYIWVINNFIAHWGVTYIRDLMVLYKSTIWFSVDGCWPHSLPVIWAVVWDNVVRGLSFVSPLPWEVMGLGYIRPKIMMITLNSAACCFQGLSLSTSPSSANLEPGYSNTVDSGSSEVLHIFLTLHLPPDGSKVLFCRNSHVNCR